MRELIPEGDDVRKAVSWISAKIQEDPSVPVLRYVNEATLKFDLSPRDSEMLLNFYIQRKEWER